MKLFKPEHKDSQQDNMWCCADDSEVSVADREIQKQLNRAGREQKHLIKILLLGAGESGKSTVAKQFRLIHEDNFNDEERIFYTSIIHSNIYSSIKSMVTAGSKLGIEIEDEKCRVISDALIEGSYEWDGELNHQNAKDFSLLWNNPDVQEMYEKRAEYQLSDCAEYYLNNIKRIAKSDYLPTDDDILRSRVKTTGVIETKFKLEGTDFSLVDVGGQRSERRKWMLCFEDVTTVIFCVSLSGYNLKLYEDNTTNRMQESLMLFQETVNSTWFSDKPFILFLNKHDLFLEKVQEQIPLTICFPDYKGDQDPDEMIDFITRKYADTMVDTHTLYVHVTTATDTSNISAVWMAVRGIIMEEAMKKSGLVV
eukprot:TRINITY_DN6424_c0_g1_i1.p1 TRINITY_DN6424_c0_g1~~TRINITY_DN6424_c0_g1_i1.p1  ORF type:complete len:367 (+),score=80.46 TRINITY_DN6424_c0_g1_i1:37-1137(+)